MINSLIIYKKKIFNTFIKISLRDFFPLTD